MMTLRPFRRFRVFRDKSITTRFLADVAKDVEKHFKESLDGKKSGRMYTYRGRPHRASAPGEFPANMSGALKESISSTSNYKEAVIGSNVEYSKWLAEGRTRMSPRSMSKEALQEVVPTMSSRLRGFIRFERM